MKHRSTDNTIAVRTVVGAHAVSRSQTRLALLSIGFVLATVVAAHVKLYLPFTPVPVTMQTSVVLLAGLCLGARWGSMSQVGYLALGALGLTAFAGGLAAMAGPNGGYLIGFVVAAAVAGWIYSVWRSTAGAVLACLVATSVIYLFGCLWLARIAGGSAVHVLATGVVPFLAGDMLKMAMVLLLVRGPFTGAWMRRIFHHN